MMIYVHGKDWDAKLLEALVAEGIKPMINTAIPEVNHGNGIFQGFDMENFFDTESLIYTLNALYRR